MSPEAQRIAIAEACGYQFSHPETAKRRLGLEQLDFHQVPDYLNDLNAMHEAEKSLTDNQYYYVGSGDKAYQQILTGICMGHRTKSATATQRAEAFLKTIGKWEDSAKA